jgi:hypothetical protein
MSPTQTLWSAEASASAKGGSSASALHTQTLWSAEASASAKGGSSASIPLARLQEKTEGEGKPILKYDSRADFLPAKSTGFRQKGYTFTVS